MFASLDSLAEAPNHSLIAIQRTDQETNRILQAGIRNDWNDFWVRTMNNCPSGPTLFRTRPQGLSPSVAIHRSLDNIPRYLFRIYDSNSSGLNTDTVFASEHSFSQDGTQHQRSTFFYWMRKALQKCYTIIWRKRTALVAVHRPLTMNKKTTSSPGPVL